MGSREGVEDVARILGRQAAAVVWRTAHQHDVVTMADHAGVPVLNALTDEFHPCQLLADLQTVRERKGRLAGLRVGFVGDGACNMGSSWVLAGALAGLHVTVSAPVAHRPDAAVVRRAQELAATTGGSVRLVDDPVEAAVLRVARALVTKGDLDDEEYALLGERELFELTTLVGYYTTLALQLRVFRV